VRPSKLQTLSVPVVGSRSPALLIQAGEAPMRVVVRNIGGVAVFIAHEQTGLAQIGNQADQFQLPAGQSEVFVLAPKQSLSAAGSGGGGQVSIAASEAVPVGKHWMES
jgi:hypothetical protein